ncbi:MAG TPA: segregation/condensation protein A, partial [Candidatus Acidoferrum sp.]
MVTPEHKLTGKGEGNDAEISAEKHAPERRETKELASAEWRMAGEKSAGEERNTAGGPEQSTSPGGGYQIRIPMYEGPLDLLLDLIKQQKMSIHDIQISEITAQYLDYLHKLEELDVDVSAEFIYMAATLIYIKSKMLLPPDPLASPEEQAADPRAELVQRLVEHEKFKNAAQLLYQKQQIEENVWSKPDKSLYQDPGTAGELVVSLVDL